MGTRYEIRRQRVQKLVNEVLPPLVHPRWVPLSVGAHFVKGEPIPAAEALAAPYEPFTVGSRFGGAWSTTWFRLTGTVPAEWHGEQVVGLVDLGYHDLVGFGAEGLVFSGGQPLQGLNWLHDSIPISVTAGGGPVELFVEAAANPYVPWGGINWPLLLPDYEGDPLYKLCRADLAVHDAELAGALHDLSTLLELASALGPEDPLSVEILVACDRAALAVDHSDVRASLLRARDLWAHLFGSGSGVEDRGSRGQPDRGPHGSPDRGPLGPPGADGASGAGGHAPGSHLVTAIGHAHIDSAWLWPIRETRRKCARTFSTALHLIDTNDAYRFSCSQAQQHAFVEQDYPELFGRMVEMARAGRFEPVGSMWVEPDTNIPSGESLVRQLVHGKRYFLERYGIETRDCWLPDAFGFSGNLPQILQAAGVRFFLTQKLSWSEIDRFPYHTFFWEGIDGSRVLAHFPPADTYNGQMSAKELLASVRSFGEHGLSTRSLYPYGHGDGGGGPSRAMLERYERLRRLPIGATIELGRVATFFESLEAEIEESETALDQARPGTVTTPHAGGQGGLPIWVGELYLEHHRAVQTTHARVKLGNRRCEELLGEAELWWTAVTAASREGARDQPAENGPGHQEGRPEYPRSRLDCLWKTLLLHQFHDILPGSSIHWVYDDTEAAHRHIETDARELVEVACSTLARAAGAGDDAVVCFNPASHRRQSLVEVDLAPDAFGTLPYRARSVEIPSDGAEGSVIQPTTSGRGIFLADVPGCGWATYELCRDGSPVDGSATPRPGAPPVVTAKEHGTGGVWLDNGLVSAHVDASGHLSSILDYRLGRDLIAPGERGNVLQLHDDLPNDSDAWDVSLGAFDRATELAGLDSLEIVEGGPVRATVRIKRSFGASSIVEDVSLVAGSPVVAISCDVDWHERHKFLKVAFPVDVRADAASFEIAFGHLRRPTHANTTWDLARFEVPAHRWADLSEAGFGVSLLNDCKYGYDVRSNVMRLSLLRGPTWPDPEADQGRHRFTYGIVGHRGLAADAMDVMDEAERLNMAIRPITGGKGSAPSDYDTSAAATVPPRASVLRAEGAMVSALKLADEGDGVVVRIFEPRGGQARVVLGSDLFELGELLPVDVLERPLDGKEAIRTESSGEVHLLLRPFEVTTLRTLAETITTGSGLD